MWKLASNERAYHPRSYCVPLEKKPPPCSGQYVVGAVPWMNTSVIVRGQPAAASWPVSGSSSAVTMLDGTGKGSAKYCDGMKR